MRADEMTLKDLVAWRLWLKAVYMSSPYRVPAWMFQREKEVRSAHPSIFEEA